MQKGDLVRIRHKERTDDVMRAGTGPVEWREWWEEGGIVVEEYQTWEKIVTVFHEGEIKRISARDVQLSSRIINL